MVSKTMFILNFDTVNVMMIHKKRPKVLRNMASEELVSSFHCTMQSMALTNAII